MDLTILPYHHHQQQLSNVAQPEATTKYKECLRNHAASIGGHANDGCGEFMSHGRDSFTCAACGCHRNFHRREVPGGLVLMYDVGTMGVGSDKIAINAAPLSSWMEEAEDAERAAARMKRFRTKFSREQKDRMWEFAERIGWRLNKNDGVEIDQFCDEIGIKPSALKVWMHNNKNARRRSEAPSETSAGSLPPAPVPQPVGV